MPLVERRPSRCSSWRAEASGRLSQAVKMAIWSRSVRCRARSSESRDALARRAPDDILRGAAEADEGTTFRVRSEHGELRVLRLNDASDFSAHIADHHASERLPSDHLLEPLALCLEELLRTPQLRMGRSRAAHDVQEMNVRVSREGKLCGPPNRVPRLPREVGRDENTAKHGGPHHSWRPSNMHSSGRRCKVPRARALLRARTKS